MEWKGREGGTCNAVFAFQGYFGVWEGVGLDCRRCDEVEKDSHLNELIEDNTEWK